MPGPITGKPRVRVSEPFGSKRRLIEHPAVNKGGDEGGGYYEKQEKGIDLSDLKYVRNEICPLLLLEEFEIKQA